MRFEFRSHVEIADAEKELEEKMMPYPPIIYEILLLHHKTITGFVAS